MPKKYDRCVKKVKRKIVTGKIPKTYRLNHRIKKSNPYAICRHAMKRTKNTKVNKKVSKRKPKKRMKKQHII